MREENKPLIISIVVFAVVAIIALCLVLSKGKVFGKSLVSTNATSSKSETVKMEISLDKEYISVKDKEEATLKVLINGEEKSEGVEYTSSDEKIATINGGVIKAVGSGTAKITAKYKDVTETVDINCIIPISNMKFTATSSSIKVGNQLQLKLQVTPSDANINTLIYSSSNDEIATVNKNGIVTGIQRGKVTITLLDTYTGEEKSVNLTIR